MPDKSLKARLFVDHPLAADQSVSLNGRQAHYLLRVMRSRNGDFVSIFNGRDGEWSSELQMSQKEPHLVCRQPIRPQEAGPDVWLLMAPLRPARVEFAVEKAVELGVSRIVFVMTDHTLPRGVNLKRLQAIAIEAVEQCGGLHIPEIEDVSPLVDALKNWPSARTLLFCDETTMVESVPSLQSLPQGPSALLVGPEGGFSETERREMMALDKTLRLSLGQRLLRSETAVVAGLTMINVALAARVSSEV